MVASTGNRAPIAYRLDLLENAELAGEYFEPKKDWNFKEWASESFGVFMAMRYGASKSDLQKKLPRELRKSSFTHRKKSVMAEMAH